MDDAKKEQCQQQCKKATVMIDSKNYKPASKKIKDMFYSSKMLDRKIT